jgi:hypothetical protein
VSGPERRYTAEEVAKGGAIRPAYAVVASSATASLTPDEKFEADVQAAVAARKAADYQYKVDREARRRHPGTKNMRVVTS